MRNGKSLFAINVTDKYISGSERRHSDVDAIMRTCNLKWTHHANVEMIYVFPSETIIKRITFQKRKIIHHSKGVHRKNTSLKNRPNTDALVGICVIFTNTHKDSASQSLKIEGNQITLKRSKSTKITLSTLHKFVINRYLVVIFDVDFTMSTIVYK